jgi:hypothetical protein
MYVLTYMYIYTYIYMRSPLNPYMTIYIHEYTYIRCRIKHKFINMFIHAYTYTYVFINIIRPPVIVITMMPMYRNVLIGLGIVLFAVVGFISLVIAHFRYIYVYMYMYIYMYIYLYV